MSVTFTSSTQRTLLDLASNPHDQDLSENKMTRENGMTLVDGDSNKDDKKPEEAEKTHAKDGSGDTEMMLSSTEHVESSLTENVAEETEEELNANPKPTEDGLPEDSQGTITESRTPSQEKKVRITTPTKSPGSGPKKAKKSTPWYNVLSSTYKSKLDEFRKVFKTLPDNERLVADYSCALQKDILVHGRMYITENWICFYANIFRWETVLTVPLKDVTAITKERTIRFIPNAIQVSTSSEKYFFASFMSRDKAFHLLFKVWQNGLLSQSMTPNEYWSWIHKLYGSDLGLDEEEFPSDYVEQEEVESAKDRDSTKADDREDVYDVEPPAEDGTEDSDILKPDEEDEDLISQPDRHSNSDHEEAIDLFTLLDFEGKIVLDEYYNIPVDQLYSCVFTGPDPLYTKVLEANRSTEISFTEWKTEGEEEERTFLHNMHISTGLKTKTCAVIERYSTKKCWLKPGKSYLLDTYVQNKGVPYCDYFVVRVGHAMTAVNSTKSHLRITLKVDFVKNPMGLMKNLIERTTESGVRQNKELLDKLIRTHLERQYKRKKTRKKGSLETPNGEEPPPNHRNMTPPVISAMKWVLPKTVSTKLESKSLHITTIICITLGLFILFLFNIYLFFQLQYMYSSSSSHSGYPSVSLDEVMDSIESLPEESREWLLLLHQQQQYHELEMKKWREIMAMSVNLMKQIESTFEELTNGIQQSSSIPDLSQLIMDMQKNMADKGGAHVNSEL